ncbi:hypothetical protein ABIB40_003142 [Pedobacter sp. UYP30]|uniref:DUF1772 domain-containing protein n=1 Tax=Pedobacter sp. UYP30 TaxID=1756400 RepID=UPI003394E436
MKNKIKIILLFLAVIVNGGLLFVNIYNSLVDSANWGSNIPASIEIARNYFTTKSPTDFFKIFGIVIHVIAINCVIRFWNADKKIRLYTISALALILTTDLLTAFYFFPRNDLIFGSSSSADIQTLTLACNEWNTMNWARSTIILGIVVLYCFSLNNFLKTKQVNVDEIRAAS